MTTTTDLTLDERAAKVLGWETMAEPLRRTNPYGADLLYTGNPGLEASDRKAWLNPQCRPADLPAFSRSIDAQRPLEEMARAQGWYLSGVLEFAERFVVAWAHDKDGYQRALSPTEPEARLACVLKVLEGAK